MDIEVFILVGGKSSRMGLDKGTLRVGETTLIERTTATARNAISPRRITLVAAGIDQMASLFGHTETLPFVYDVYQNRGPLGAIHAALANAQTEWVLILACDFPFITPQMLRRLSGHLSTETDAVAPVQQDGNIQPLCAFYRTAPCLKAIEETLIKNRLTPPLKSIFEKVRARFVRFEELGDLPEAELFFFNLNAPKDFITAATLLRDRGV